MSNDLCSTFPTGNQKLPLKFATHLNPYNFASKTSTQGAQFGTQTTTYVLCIISNTFSQSRVGHEWAAPQPVAPQVSNTLPSQESCPALKKRSKEKKKLIAFSSPASCAFRI